ncbi:TPA: hypothetical protein ANIA_11417 [Aspergillus nidulans FGSC A4]|uniref:Uncharacterized protein n=1 Tax=Emericella nidulans (strain FGSC A4 / ATCC 38163 / CBS 112.46 / NRRL 194 / M139) TaxID=227321 RepID=C8V6Z7_EMENI|nr:TPA: hypothetical protein ANIA_11417 [Aspergillus nidulans FGSC A4]
MESTTNLVRRLNELS